MAWQMKGTVAKCDHREYGFASVEVVRVGGKNGSVDALFQGLGESMDVRLLFVKDLSAG
jgi:GMP synthase (glutamine-hydrolysing)